MKIVEVQFNSWDKTGVFSCDNEKFVLGDYVIVETGAVLEIGKAVAFRELPAAAPEVQADALRPVLRKATKEDLEAALALSSEKQQADKICRALIKKHALPIKLVDVYFTFDGSRITFAFIADGRVDFRELLKDLNREFHKNIRLQQIGIRDEIKISGDTGCCGRSLCCQTFFKDLGNVTSDLAELQQIAHRGSDRLSGVCGRLKCCLRYEKDLYEQLADRLPMIGEKIKTKHGRGEVIGWHVLKQTVDVLMEDGETIVEVPID